MITFKKDLPIISVYLRLKTTLIDIGILLHYMIFNEKLDVDIVLEKKVLEEVPNKIVKPDLYILKRRQNKPKTHNMALVNDFFSTIKEGNKKLIQYMYAVSQEDVELMLIEDPLRNQKPWNYCDYLSHSICNRRKSATRYCFCS